MSAFSACTVNCKTLLLCQAFEVDVCCLLAALDSGFIPSLQMPAQPTESAFAVSLQILQFALGHQAARSWLCLPALLAMV